MLQKARNLFCKLLTRYFSLVPLPQSFEDIAKNPSRFIVVYRYQSVYFEALIRSFSQRSKLRDFFNAAEDSSKISESLLFCALEDIPLLTPKRFRDRQFVTMNVIRGRGPIRTTPKYSLNLIDILALLFGPALQKFFLAISFGDPLQQTLESTRLSSRQLQRQLKLDFYRNIRVVRGTPFQSIEIQSQIVLSGDDFQRDIKNYVERNNTTHRRAMKIARREFFRIAANPRAWAFIPASLVAHFLIKRLFSDLVVKGLDDFTRAAKQHPVVLVPLHRSHLDYVLMGYVLYRSKINPPLVAAGINLSFWPAGRIIRSVGGYFVRRDAKRDRIHASILKRYVTYLLKRGHLQEFFIEGGRSRSGAMRYPKLGLLKIFFDAIKKGLRRDLLFVPVSITYEHVIEDSVYGDENTGKAKVKENLFSLFKARKMLNKRYGEVTIRFGEALSLSQYLKKSNTSESRSTVRDLGLSLTQKIQDGTSLTLSSLLYTALMSSPNYGLVESRYRMFVNNLLRNAMMSFQLSSGASELTPTLRKFLETPEQDLTSFTDHLVVKRTKYLNENFYYIPGKRRFTADFYRNSILHIFLPSSLLSVAELGFGSTNDQAVQKIFEIFRFNFFVPSWDEFRERVSTAKQEFHAMSIIGQDEFLNRIPGFYTPELLLPAIQSMLWLIHHLAKMADGKQFVTEQVLIKTMQQHSDAGKYAGLLTATESCSKPHLSGAINALRQLKHIESKKGAGAEQLRMSKFPDELFELLIQLNRGIIDWQFSHLHYTDPAIFKTSTINSYQVH